MHAKNIQPMRQYYFSNEDVVNPNDDNKLVDTTNIA